MALYENSYICLQRKLNYYKHFHSMNYVTSHLSKEGEEEKTIRELKEVAKWSRSQQEMKTAINELAARGEIALPVLEEVLNVTAHEDIKAACIEAIKAIKGKEERREEEEEKGTVKKTKGEAQVVVEEG
jgi:hypothetical protein